MCEVKHYDYQTILFHHRRTHGTTRPVLVQLEPPITTEEFMRRQKGERMKIKHYCPKCNLKKEVEGMTANLRSMWKYHFGEDYDFYKTNQQIKKRDEWIFEKVKILQQMNELQEKSEKIEDRFAGNKDFRELLKIQRELQFLKQRFDYNEKEYGF